MERSLKLPCQLADLKNHTSVVLSLKKAKNALHFYSIENRKAESVNLNFTHLANCCVLDEF